MVVVVVLPSDQDFAATNFSFRTTMSVFRCASWSLSDAISRSLLSRISCILAINCASSAAAAVDGLFREDCGPPLEKVPF